ncbi:MAG: type III-A CRISPR-associated protein Cas10/Csm1 [Bacillota bacterium]
MMDTIEYRTVVLAGLLHDIGKFLQRGDYGPIQVTGKHPAVSQDFVQIYREFFSQFVNSDLLELLVKKHHEGTDFPEDYRPTAATGRERTLAFLVSRADNYSSMERGEGGTRRDFRTAALASVFSEIELYKEAPPTKYYRPMLLHPENAFPVDNLNVDRALLTSHIRSFGKEMATLAASKIVDFNSLYSWMLSLLEKYTWCIPSSTQALVPDVSLYDHLRTTSAIAAALYHYHEENGWEEATIKNDKIRKFRLIVGDFTGIQKYIFGISSTGAGGVAKRLRARSFYVSALLSAVTDTILHALNLPPVNLVMCAAGQFYLLLPNTETTRARVSDKKREIEAWLLREYEGRIALAMGEVAFSGSEMEQFGEVLYEANCELDIAKTKPFFSALTRGETWHEASFQLPLAPRSHACSGCGKKLAVGDAELCAECSRDRDLGSVLANGRYLAFYQGTRLKGSFELYPGIHLGAYRQKPADLGSPYKVVKLNDTDLSDLYDLPVTTEFVANHVPVFSDEPCAGCKGCQDRESATPGQPKFFDCLAYSAKGKAYLACLKADVDNLGNLFVNGLRREGDREVVSISRLSTFSRMLNLFFSGVINSMIQRDHPNCYTVYSGGDDLLVVGPWDEVLMLAERVSDAFNQFTGSNPNLTISAGVSLFKPRFPVSKAIEIAAANLEEAKRDSQRDVPKNQIYVFGERITWMDYRPLHEQAKQLETWVKLGVTNTGFLHRLRQYAEMFRRYRDEGALDGLKFLALLCYDISRNLPKPNDLTEEERALRSWVESLRNLESTDLKHLAFLTTYALTATRQG